MDPIDQAKEAFERALDLDAQLILVPGDIFESRTPNQEIWSESMKTLSLASEKDNEDISLVDTIGKERSEITALPLRGVPVVAIHGNHERRGRGFVDSIEALESAGLLIKLHHNTVVFETPEGKLALHGMGYVPGRYARDLLDRWTPEPVEGATNIFILHQGLGKFTFASDEYPSLQEADLPEGFDLYISGHVHYRAESKVYGVPLLFPGSAVRTQLLPIESEVPKGFYMIDLKRDSLDYEFFELESIRDFFYEKQNFEEATPRGIEEWLRGRVNELLQRPFQNQNKRPLARIRLTGTLARGSSRSGISAGEIESEFEDKILLSISREDLSSPDLEEKTQFLKSIREERISMEERGLKILESNLEDLDYDEEFESRQLFELLSEDKVDEAFAKVWEKVEELAGSKLEEKQ